MRGPRGVWPWRLLVRFSRASRRPRGRVIVTGRPYDWELDGFGDDLYGPARRVPKPQVARHPDTRSCNPHVHAHFIDGARRPMLDYGFTSLEETGPHDDE